MRSYLLTDVLGGPEPSVKREAGINDARRGKPRLSNDRDYLKGYELGQRLKQDDQDVPDPSCGSRQAAG